MRLMVPPLPAASRPRTAPSNARRVAAGRLQLDKLDLQGDELFLVHVLVELLVVGIAAAGQRGLVDGFGQVRIVDVERAGALGAVFLAGWYVLPMAPNSVALFLGPVSDAPAQVGNRCLPGRFAGRAIIPAPGLENGVAAAVLSRAQELWLRFGGRLEPTVARLYARRAELAVAIALTVVFVIAGGLSLRVATLGLMAAAALIVSWPIDDSVVDQRTAAQSPTDGDRLWRKVIDAVPEPAVALDGNGRIVHANRLADEQFGARRRAATSRR